MSAGYRVLSDASLRARNTFRVDARAARLIEVDDARALPDLAATAFGDGPPMVLGGGSNLLFAADPAGTVVALAAKNVEVVADDGGDAVLIRADAGVEWHGLVMSMLRQGYRGLENLALIPGTVGAAPIQNIGAYGVEVCDRIHAVEVYEHGAGMARLGRDDCRFAYRDSVFKREPDRYIVTAVEFSLSRSTAPHVEYAGIRDELAAMGVEHAPDAAQVAEAVIRLRRRKLPDPAAIGNAGSFFKNPIVPRAQAEALQAEHATLPVFRGDGEATRKLSAAWLIDACGWKGHRDGDAGVSDKHALVLVNHGNASGMQLLDLARRIAASVRERFGVALEPEPRVIGAKW
ncbi:UDP-N-acetylmuramate dehydrogenase [Luteimonas sp. SX5]|uniref:UDP-N-acetylenolpyruvoylglucosamine reductase n=1 Tax=Luteimonas galliterrae TaxID=2940486 RepID=A0ABT0MGH6_9GAMM|nr:UDP-N-acetylmuramate dehydrogenase [Luteimonas galliterrae]MCL1633976.1 UDP-N-acetylmuramate dehydrogenase [Luteimonas galliterrae]